MKVDTVKVSYRDTNTKETVSLGTIDIDQPESIDEALELYGEEKFLEYAHTAFVIDRQRQHRDGNRPDKPKSVSAVSKFRQLSPEKQEELLRVGGVI